MLFYGHLFENIYLLTRSERREITGEDGGRDRRPIIASLPVQAHKREPLETDEPAGGGPSRMLWMNEQPWHEAGRWIVSVSVKTKLADGRLNAESLRRELY